MLRNCTFDSEQGSRDNGLEFYLVLKINRLAIGLINVVDAYLEGGRG